MTAIVVGAGMARFKLKRLVRHGSGIAGILVRPGQQIDRALGGQCHDLEAAAGRLDDLDGLGADGTSGAEQDDVGA